MSDSCNISIKTVPPYEITDVTAKSGGFKIFATHPVTQKGIVWGTAPSPTTALVTKTDDGDQGLPYDSEITGITIDTTYYVRAYAINSCGTFYGDEWSFKTSKTEVGNLNQCYEEVITIEPNETYVIPYNSQVVTVVNASSLESDCFNYNE